MTENKYDLLPKSQFKAHPKDKILVIIYSDPEKNHIPKFDSKAQKTK